MTRIAGLRVPDTVKPRDTLGALSEVETATPLPC
jgi:hypothetical protein